MCSRFPEVVRALIACLCAAAAQSAELRVCADPNNLPYSNEYGRGFENEIAAVLADELKLDLRFVWQAQWQGFVRKSIGEGLCDVFVSVPVDFERLATTTAYYRSSYVFVTRAEHRDLDDFNVKALRGLRIGVQLIGDDFATTPPGLALARAGLIDNVVGYPLFDSTPAAERMIADLAARRIDVALVWGPQAGYFAHRSPEPVFVRARRAPKDLSAPFEFDIGLGVRKDNAALKTGLQTALERRRRDIDAILAKYFVPRTDVQTNSAEP